MQKIIQWLKIAKIGHGGIGIASLPDGKKVLIKGGALPGSIVDVRVVKNKKDYLEAHLLEIKSYDQNIVNAKPLCAHFFSPLWEANLPVHKVGCGGCKWQVMTYDAQLKLKEDILKDAFAKLLKKQEIDFLPIVASPLHQGYRNKIEFSFGVYKQLSEAFKKGKKSGSGEQELLDQGLEKYAINTAFNLGFHKQGEFSKIIDVDACGLISPGANQVFDYLKTLFLESGLPVYDQKTHEGFFRHLVMREGVNTQQMMINLSVASDYFNISKEGAELWNALLEKIKADAFLQEKISTFVISHNNGLADIVNTPETQIQTLWGEGAIYEKLIFDRNQEVTEAVFRIWPSSFFQTNTLGAQLLFSTAIKMAGEIKGNVLDLYCGAGSIGISLLKQGLWTELVGVEIVEKAIVDAWYNAKINGIEDRVYFVASPAEKMLINYPELEAKIKNVGLVVIDPPREGLHPNVISYLGELKKQYQFKLLYISCNPVTMARDMELLLDQKFEFSQVQPVDMFPHTHHLECISVLE